MSILNALRQQHSSIDDLAKLPQAMIMQMAQKKEISADMVAPILSRKAEMMDAVARSKALQPQPPVPTVMEQVMAKNIQAENPQAMPPQGMPPQSPMEGPAPTSPEQVGVGQIPVPERQYAGGGIIAFKQGDLIDLEDDIDEEDLIAEYADAMRSGEMAMSRGMEGNAGTGFKYTEPMPSGGSKGINHQGGKHPYESLVTTKAKEHGVDPMLASYILNKETGGMKNPENARSSAGAMGIAQFMPATARQYNINPDVPEEAATGMSKHLKHLVNEFGDPKIAAIAYNWGEGNTKKWLNAGADMDKLPKETKKYVASLAQGGEVRHFDLGGDIDTTGAELDALRSGTQSLQDKLMSIGSRGTGRDEIQAAYDNALKLRKEKEMQYEALMGQAGVDKPAFFPHSSLGTERVKPNPMVQRESSGNINPPKVAVTPAVPPAVPLSAKPPVSTAPTAQDLQNFDQAAALFQAEQANAKKPQQAAPQEQSYWDKVMSQMGEDRASLASQRADSKNMALLAAGLGMMGGTSPYAFANIGQGGLHGVQYLSEANKQHAAEKAALDKNMLVAQRYKELGETAKGNQSGLLAIRGGELLEKTRSHNMTALNQLEKNSLAKATAALKSKGLLGTDLADPQTQQMLTDWVQKDLANNQAYNKIYQDTFGFGYDVGQKGGGGSSLASDAAAEKAKREAEKNKEKK